MKTNQPFEPTVFTYTLADALKDGVLIEVTPTANHAGLNCRTVITTAAWSACTDKPPGCAEEPVGIFDCLWMLRCAAAGAVECQRIRSGTGEILLFSLYVQSADSPESSLRPFKAVLDLGEDGNPLITIMLHKED